MVDLIQMHSGWDWLILKYALFNSNQIRLERECRKPVTMTKILYMWR